MAFQFQKGHASHRIKNYDTNITIRVNSKELQEFRELCGGSYQDKIRDLMNGFVKSMNEIDKIEQAKRNAYLKTKKYINNI